MNSVRMTHFFDAIKTEPTVKDECDFMLDSNNVEQEYHCKEEVNVTWDERDNDYGASQENYDFSNNSSYKLNNPIVIIERLPKDVVDKYSHSFQRDKRLENSVTLKCKKRDFVQYYQKICTECKQRPPGKDIGRCKSCKIRLKYECKKCSKQLSTWEGIVYHLSMKCMDKGHYYACFNCNFKSPFRCSVKHHLKNVHSILCSSNRIPEFKRENVQNDVHKCSKCGRQFKKFPSILRHIQTCGQTKNDAKSFAAARKREKVQNDVAFTVKMHKCSKCGQQFKKLPPLLRHIQTCGQTKNDDKSFAAARKTYRDQCLHYCLQCNQIVKNVGVGKFSKTKCQKCHSKLSFKCKKCDKVSQSYTSIYEHLKIKHENVKDAVFTCPECNYKTFSLDNLARHVRRLHFIDSHGECSQCGRKCKNIILLREHLRSCLNDPKFQCDYCSYRFKSKATLKTHIVDVHTGGNEIDCPWCGNTLKSKGTFRRHVRYCKKRITLSGQ